MNHTTSAIAVGGVSSTFWLHSLEAVSNIAAQLMPILGVVWLATQVIQAWRRRKVK